MSLPHLIFDLGGVLYDISAERCVSAFSELMGGGREQRVWQAMREEDAWKAHEKGLMTDAAFRKEVRRILDLDCTDEEVDRAWNALLIGPRPEILPELLRLRRRHRMVLLSNTNNIHYRHLYPGARDLLEVFEARFLSFEMGCRKPEPEIFEQVLTEMEWRASDCLFLDDSPANVQGALESGIDSVCVESGDPDTLVNLLRQKFPT